MAYTVNQAEITAATQQVNVSYSVPTTTPTVPVNRFVITSRIPVITTEEILTSITVHDLINEIFREILVDNDKQLITNILDQSKKIILTQDQLLRVLMCVLSINSAGTVVTKDDIKIKYSEDILSSCLKTSVSPFKNIISIKVFEQELGQVQSEVYTTLSSRFKISLETFYQPLKPLGQV